MSVESQARELLHATRQTSESRLTVDSDAEDPDNFSCRHLLPKAYVHRTRQETTRLLIYEYTPQGEFQWREMTRFDVHQKASELALQSMAEYKAAHAYEKVSSRGARDSTRSDCHLCASTPSVSRTTSSLSPVHTHATFAFPPTTTAPVPSSAPSTTEAALASTSIPSTTLSASTFVPSTVTSVPNSAPSAPSTSAPLNPASTSAASVSADPQAQDATAPTSAPSLNISPASALSVAVSSFCVPDPPDSNANNSNNNSNNNNNSNSNNNNNSNSNNNNNSDSNNNNNSNRNNNNDDGPRPLHPTQPPMLYDRPAPRDPAHLARHHGLTKAEREEALLHTLNNRDLRKIDSAFLTSSEPAILVRKHAVLLNLIYVKAVIFYNAILILPPEGADDILVTLRDQFLNREQGEGWAESAKVVDVKNVELQALDRSPIPFEMVAYDAVFATAIELLLQAFREVKGATNQATSKFTSRPASAFLLDSLGEVKKSHRLFQALVHGIRDAVATTLASDEDMWQMNLTKIYKNPHWYDDKNQFPHHQQMEMFLESCLESIEGLVRQMDVVEKDIEATEMLINIQLDVNRNRILAFELTVSTFSTALGIGAVIAGIFGMNVDTHVFDKDPTEFWFKAVVILIGLVCVVFMAIAFINLKRLGVIDLNQGCWRILTCRRPDNGYPVPIAHPFQAPR